MEKSRDSGDAGDVKKRDREKQESETEQENSRFEFLSWGHFAGNFEKNLANFFEG